MRNRGCCELKSGGISCFEIPSLFFSSPCPHHRWLHGNRAAGEAPAFKLQEKTLLSVRATGKRTRGPKSSRGILTTFFLPLLRAVPAVQNGTALRLLYLLLELIFLYNHENVSFWPDAQENGLLGAREWGGGALNSRELEKIPYSVQNWPKLHVCGTDPQRHCKDFENGTR